MLINFVLADKEYFGAQFVFFFFFHFEIIFEKIGKERIFRE